MPFRAPRCSPNLDTLLLTDFDALLFTNLNALLNAVVSEFLCQVHNVTPRFLVFNSV
ncbi:MAG: hypothetical protein LR015_06750 [Verrucomicrobia bacterium]|nr:hypothetical protein [Verrucomicrobiota bacterium]